MPKILHIFSTLALGGPQRRFIDLLRGQSRPYEHIVHAMDDTYDALDQLDSLTPDRLDRSLPIGGTVSRVRAARRILKELKPDLLVTYNWGAVEWALANRFLPIVPGLHIQDGFNPDEVAQEIPRRVSLRRLAYRGRTRVLVPSFTLYDIARQSWGISRKKLTLIPNGVALDRFTKQANPTLIRDVGLEGHDGPIIGTVAALRREKNLGRLIEAFRIVADNHPRARLLIIGDGVGMLPLKTLARGIGLEREVIFAGHQDAPERLLPALDVFALSSDTEQMPISVIEAMATGLPVASTDVGDIARMVGPHNKPFIKGRDAAPLAESLLDLLEDAALRRTIGDENSEKARSDYDQRLMIGAFEALYDGLMKKR